MQDRVGSTDLANGAVRYVGYNAYKVVLRGIWLKLEDEPLEKGTPLNRETLLSAETEQILWPASGKPTDATVNNAFQKLIEAREVGDILITVRRLVAPWHLCDGSTFSQTAYPDLYAVLGSTTLPNISYSDDTGTYIKMADA